LQTSSSSILWPPADLKMPSGALMRPQRKGRQAPKCDACGKPGELLELGARARDRFMARRRKGFPEVALTAKKLCFTCLFGVLQLNLEHIL